METKGLSLRLYDLLRNLVGSEDVVRTRRQLFAAKVVLFSYKFNVTIPSGSKVEGLDLTNSDYDYMLLHKRVQVFECMPDFINNQKIVCQMDFHETKLGFTRLKVLNSIAKQVLHRNFLTVFGDAVYLSRKHIQLAYLKNTNKDLFMIHGPCLSTKTGDLEGLLCYRCHEWITAAQPWIHRPRGSWPCSDVIYKIIDFGVLFVPVGCKNSEHEDLEWRISFSIAEKTLIHSFCHTQLLCYAALKIVLSDIIKPRHGELLCSYFIKTIIFWLAEEIDQFIWRPNNIVWCFQQCLKRLIYCVTYKICLHYFIPDINFFDERFTESEHQQLLVTMTELQNVGVHILTQTETFQNYYRETSLRGVLVSNALSILNLIKTTILAVHVTPIEIIEIRKLFRFSSKAMLLLLSFYFSYRADMQPINIKDCNKSFYTQYANVSSCINIGISSDSVNGWCKLASLFYISKQYAKCRMVIRYCLSKCTPDKIFLSVDPYVTKAQSENLCRKYFTRSIRHFVIDTITFCSNSILPPELLPLFRQCLSLPPVVYLHFLDSLCAYYQKNYRDMIISIECMEYMFINRRYYIGSFDMSDDIFFCLSVVQSLLQNK